MPNTVATHWLSRPVVILVVRIIMALDKQHSDDNWRKHMSDVYLTYLLAL